MAFHHIFVTGENSDLGPRLPTLSDVTWQCLPVLEFERLSVEYSILTTIESHPYDWLILTSHRTIRFFSQFLLEHSIQWPVETQIACIGESTAHEARKSGFDPDFYPTEMGTHGFLFEFRELISNNPIKPSILLPRSETGRTLLQETLIAEGCKVTSFPLYRTLAKKEITPLSKEDWKKTSLIIFTSPSSFSAFQKNQTLPSHIKVAAIGDFTASFIRQAGYTCSVLPNGDFERAMELL